MSNQKAAAKQAILPPIHLFVFGVLAGIIGAFIWSESQAGPGLLAGVVLLAAGVVMAITGIVRGPKNGWFSRDLT